VIILKSSHELVRMREAGRIVAEVLARLREKVAPGVTTAELDALAYQIIVGYGAKPSFKGYRGFPASLCVSINEEIVHGIPGKRVLREGDIVSMDVGAIHRGYQGDAAITVGVGEKVNGVAQHLMEVTAEALQVGIAQARAGKRTGDISWAIQKCAEGNGYAVVREYTGHGIGRDMHEEPQIPNFGEPGRGVLLKPGMTFALEPMVTVGDYHTRVLDDNWTVVTLDGQLSAHFEHTVAVTEGEPEILTCL
jgi:methionyl aminopeptidase